ncbi:zinc metalloproteinase nas-13-like [Contarinia nasturtii]|uniref:zinc metalloproteinase nas-13-like n=1 Tax=Contarinia nasturtii TaxID=265458 RepID=UPI0012D4C103|nr:zinc metalloproteinase nas-13-like [Contarinia nasturtii]
MHGNESVVKDAMSEIESVSCIAFKQRNDEDGYVYFTSSDFGCYTYLGYQGDQQVLNLGDGCMYKGTIMHEILHALGFLHMQSAYDRDDYIEIIWDNMMPGLEAQFEKSGSNIISHFAGGYDYKSIMHYGGAAFSKNGKLTIKTKDPNQQTFIGNRNGMSDEDIHKLNIMYNCY